jgi:hypothetical protein
MNPYLTPTIRQRRSRGDFGQRGTVRHAERISFERRHAVMAGVCWLCTDAGMRFLAAIWRLA